MRYEGMEQAAREASALLKAMSNERRLLILRHLSRSERSVGELCQLIGTPASPPCPQHLAKLRADGLVNTRREAQTIYYSLRGEAVQSILDSPDGLYCEGLADTDGERTPEPVE
ncbi:MAG: metalloregulator ArsR/SmtB family transcription factor [Rhodovibrio sp.]|nr:metalloregulator ArsR/SmtB family transcription factor [Rhodovibrio sp.]